MKKDLKLNLNAYHKQCYERKKKYLKIKHYNKIINYIYIKKQSTTKKNNKIKYNSQKWTILDGIYVRRKIFFQAARHFYLSLNNACIINLQLKVFISRDLFIIFYEKVGDELTNVNVF